jgi:glycosyltransferase involved in cell wall biosynthesis
MATILTCYYRPKPGGLCTRLFRAMRALLARGHMVHYLALAPFPIDHPRCFFHRFPWPVRHGDTLLFWAFFHLMAPPMLLGIALRHRVTHAFAFGPTYAFLMQLLRRIAGARITCFLRADTLENHRLKGRANAITALETLIEGLAIHAIHLVGVNQELTETVVRRHTKARPATQGVLPNDLLKKKAEPRKCPGNPVRLAMVGILETRKNPSFAIELVSSLTVDNWRFSFFGLGPERRGLESLIDQLGLGEKIGFMGWVAREKIWPNVDLLLMPSLHEGMPNAVLEAVAAGVPVLASDIPAHRSILPVEQLLPLDDPERWRQVLNGILNASQEKLADLAHRQWDAAAQLRFDWDECISETILQGQIR